MALLSTVAFVTIWFSTAYKELKQAKRCVENAAAQLMLQKKSYPKAKGDTNKLTASKGLDTALVIYQEVVENYDRVRSNPLYHIPAFILGFRKIEK
ncbi:MAG: hypothetical protein RR306_06130 [Clostridia bacterium]